MTDERLIPPAEGVRAHWADVPASVRGATETALGAAVVEARSQAGGFSPGVAARLRLADGSRAFVKAVCSVPNADSPAIHRREARIAAALPAHAPVPRLRWSYDDGEWVVLVFDDVEGTAPAVPWRADELARVLDALDDLARALTPSPLAVESAGEVLATTLCGWQRLAADGALADGLEPHVRAHLDDLVALEQTWPQAAAGESLAHLDLRADNLLLTADSVFVVDWPWAARAAPWVDLVAMLPSVAMQGGPDPESVWTAQPVARGVAAEQVDAFVAALGGMFTWQSLLPAPPGLPTLRAFQAGQGSAARAWLAQRRGWS